MHKPTRRSQPYRQDRQHPGMALDAMQKGQPQFLPNPADMQRRKQSMLALMAKGDLMDFKYKGGGGNGGPLRKPTRAPYYPGGPRDPNSPAGVNRPHSPRRA